jgi:hypothetical protein
MPVLEAASRHTAFGNAQRDVVINYANRYQFFKQLRDTGQLVVIHYAFVMFAINVPNVPKKFVFGVL